MKKLTLLARWCTLGFIFVFTSCSYLPETFPPAEGLIVDENADYIQLSVSDVDVTKSAIIFYPGGLVDPHAYISILDEFVLEDNRLVYIVKASSNLAILNSQKASQITSKINEVSGWILGGHSLGGSVACIDASKNLDAFDAIFLWASYSVDDLSESNIPIISITGSEDAILDQVRFEENKINLPTGVNINETSDIPYVGSRGSTLYYEIAGGNHGQFGDYGVQSGDNEASISVESQHDLVQEMLRAFFTANQL